MCDIIDPTANERRNERPTEGEQAMTSRTNHTSPTDSTRPTVRAELLRWAYAPRLADGLSLGVELTISELTDGRFRLVWTDVVANSWTELYDAPHAALARAAVICYGEATIDDGGAFFRHQATDDRVWTDDDGGDGPAAFVADAEAFLESQLDRDPTDKAGRS